MGLGDHLGNVLVTVLDRKTGSGTLAGSGGTLYDHWSADIASATDYYPGGFVMPGRNTEYSWSRMGMQGQAKDDEVYGKGNTYGYAYRMYNAQINRFFSPDPLHNEYPHNSDYAFAENDLIRCIDLEGLEKYFVINHYNSKKQLDGTSVIRVVNKNDVRQNPVDLKLQNRKTNQSYEGSFALVVDEKDGKYNIKTRDHLTKREQNIIKEGTNVTRDEDGKMVSYPLANARFQSNVPFEKANALVSSQSYTEVMAFTTDLDNKATILSKFSSQLQTSVAKTISQVRDGQLKATGIILTYSDAAFQSSTGRDIEAAVAKRFPGVPITSSVRSGGNTSGQSGVSVDFIAKPSE